MIIYLFLSVSIYSIYPPIFNYQPKYLSVHLLICLFSTYLPFQLSIYLFVGEAPTLRRTCARVSAGSRSLPTSRTRTGRTMRGCRGSLISSRLRSRDSRSRSKRPRRLPPWTSLNIDRYKSYIYLFIYSVGIQTGIITLSIFYYIYLIWIYLSV